MAITGVESAIFGVDDLEACRRFFVDFGLRLCAESTDLVEFRLPEGSRVVLRPASDASLPPPFGNGPGVREVIWGVDSQASLDGIEEELRRDRPITKDADGTIHAVDDMRLAVGFRVFDRLSISSQPQQVNAPGRIERWNRHRRWYRQAAPKLIHHVVFGFPDLARPVAFYRDRLKFRITDVARDRGIFFRAEGRHDHHNIFWAKTPEPQFLHISFGVENIDELLVGANQMQRKGWKSKLGLGRHRISSTLYYYIQCPAGGEAEYSTDTDCLDDSWRPRLWEPLFGNQYWVASLPPFLQTAPSEDVRFLEDELPELARIVR